MHFFLLGHYVVCSLAIQLTPIQMNSTPYKFRFHFVYDAIEITSSNKYFAVPPHLPFYLQKPGTSLRPIIW